MAWGAEGVIVGSALVKALAESSSPEEGLRAMGLLRAVYVPPFDAWLRGGCQCFAVQ